MTESGLGTEVVEEIASILERIPFNHRLGLRLHSITDDRVTLRFDMHEELVGNFLRQTLHGGVISATLDVTGGVAAMLKVTQRMEATVDQRLQMFGKLGTIDLRIDYLRPGSGRYFQAEGFVLRAGSRVAVSRMELHNDEENLIAVGTGTYIIS